MTPGLNFRVENTLQSDGSEMAVQLKFESIEDFEPARVVAQLVAGFQQFLQGRHLLDHAGRLEETAGNPQQAARPAGPRRPVRGPGDAARTNPAEPRAAQEDPGRPQELIPPLPTKGDER